MNGCYNAASQAASNARASSAAGSGGLYFNMGDGALEAGLKHDLETKLLRKCAKCGQPSVNVVHVLQHYVNGITRGRTYTNRCGSCGATFKTESLLRVLSQLGIGFISALVGAVFIAMGISPFSWLLIVGLLLVPSALFWMGNTVLRTIARFRNPVVPRVTH